MLMKIMLIETMLIQFMLVEIMLIEIMLIKIMLIKIIFDRTGVLNMLNAPWQAIARACDRSRDLILSTMSQRIQRGRDLILICVQGGRTVVEKVVH